MTAGYGEVQVTQPSDNEPLERRLERYVRDSIRAWDAGRGRSQQTRLGPSSLGHECTRHLAYYATQAPKIGQKGDPFPAITGTWGHSGMDEVFGPDPEMEQGARVEIGPDLFGTYDAFYRPAGCVVDWKFLGHDSLTKVRRKGPGRQYRAQLHAYGFGMMRAGWDVRNVALVCLPRSGFLRDIHVWTEPWDVEVVEREFVRWYELKEAAPVLSANPQFFNSLAMADGPCGWCPWYSPALSVEHPELACPGFTVTP